MNLREIHKNEKKIYHKNLMKSIATELGVEHISIPKYERNLKWAKVWKHVKINVYTINYLRIDEYNNVYCEFNTYKPTINELKALFRLCNEYLENTDAYHYRSGNSMLHNYCCQFKEKISKEELLELLSWHKEGEDFRETVINRVNKNSFDETKLDWYHDYGFDFKPEEIFTKEEIDERLKNAW